MRFRIVIGLLFHTVFWPCFVSAQAVEVVGEIVGSAEQDVYIEFPATVNPPTNKVLKVVWIPDGSRIDVGNVQIVSSEDGFASATLLDGQAAIGMNVIYHAEVSAHQSSKPARTVSVANSRPEPSVTRQNSQSSIEVDDSFDNDNDNDIGDELDIDTSWAYSMVNAEQWADQSILAKSQAVSRYSRALAASYGKSEKSQQNSLRLFLKSASSGYRLSQYRVAWMLENGLGTDKNLTLALAWYQIAAAKGHKKAALGMARLAGEQG